MKTLIGFVLGLTLSSAALAEMGSSVRVHGLHQKKNEVLVAIDKGESETDTPDAASSPELVIFDVSKGMGKRSRAVEFSKESGEDFAIKKLQAEGFIPMNRVEVDMEEGQWRVALQGSSKRLLIKPVAKMVSVFIVDFGGKEKLLHTGVVPSASNPDAEKVVAYQLKDTLIVAISSNSDVALFSVGIKSLK